MFKNGNESFINKEQGLQGNTNMQQIQQNTAMSTIQITTLVLYYTEH